MKKDQLSSFKPEIHPKGWGHEKWIFNSEKYCGKILVFDIGKKCSWHFHRIKDEVFYVQKGVILIKYSWSDDLESAHELILKQGESFHVPVGLRHQMTGIEDTELLEISTKHEESDSIRILKGD